MKKKKSSRWLGSHCPDIVTLCRIIGEYDDTLGEPQHLRKREGSLCWDSGTGANYAGSRGRGAFLDMFAAATPRCVAEGEKRAGFKQCDQGGAKKDMHMCQLTSGTAAPSQAAEFHLCDSIVSARQPRALHPTIWLPPRRSSHGVG
jgi:hypothetical protein